MGQYEFTPPPEKSPETQPGFSGGPPQPPPKPPKRTATDLLGPADPEGRIYLPDFIEVKELAGLLGIRPFKAVADMLAFGIFKFAEDTVDFSTAARIATKNGYVAERNC